MLVVNLKSISEQWCNNSHNTSDLLWWFVRQLEISCVWIVNRNGYIVTAPVTQFIEPASSQDRLIMISVQGCVEVRSAARKHVEQQVVGSVIPPTKNRVFFTIKSPNKKPSNNFMLLMKSPTMDHNNFSFHTAYSNMSIKNLTKISNKNTNSN